MHCIIMADFMKIKYEFHRFIIHDIKNEENDFFVLIANTTINRFYQKTFFLNFLTMEIHKKMVWKKFRIYYLKILLILRSQQ